MKKLIVSLMVIMTVAAYVAATEEKESAQGSAKETPEHKVFTPSDLQWGDAPAGLPAGAKIAVLNGNPNKKGPFTIRLQVPDGYKIAPHSHPTMERLTVISGTFHAGMGAKFDEAAGHEMPPGGFVALPAGMKHFAWSTGETIVQVDSEGPFVIKYVNPADDPRNAKK